VMRRVSCEVRRGAGGRGTRACMRVPVQLLLPTAYCLLPTAYCLLPTAYCLLPTAYCLLPTVYDMSTCRGSRSV